jgi:hypothetical protein
MTSDLTWVELARELERQPDARKDDGAVETALEARRVPGDSGIRTVALDRADVSEHSLTPHADTPHPAHVRLRATPPSTPAMDALHPRRTRLEKGNGKPARPSRYPQPPSRRGHP